MGRSLHRATALRRSTEALIGRFRLLLIVVLLSGFALTAFWITRRFQSQSASQSPVKTSPRPVEAVAALGRLEPAGDVRNLAAPSGGLGGTPRVMALNVVEGDAVSNGQVLAVFENRPKLLAELAGLKARIQTLNIMIRMQQREVSRYRVSAAKGASSLVEFQDKEDELVKLQGQRLEAIAERRALNVDLSKSELKSPVNGFVLRVHSRVGERPGNNGVVEVGASEQMQALVEVYESDINRVMPGQLVTLTSENGGFKGTLNGTVLRISPQVRQREVLSTDPTGDADARVVEVRVQLKPESMARVRQLTGMKVIARFQPSR